MTSLSISTGGHTKAGAAAAGVFASVDALPQAVRDEITMKLVTNSPKLWKLIADQVCRQYCFSARPDATLRTARCWLA